VNGRAVPGNRWDLLPGWPDEPPRVSVVVAHYRQPDQLARTLAALRAQDHPRDRLEVIVADDGSPEPPTVPPGVRLVRQSDEGFRLAAARNLGAAAASGDILVFLDADTVPEPSFVRQLTRLPALSPDVVAVGRRRHADFADIPLDAHPARARVLPEPRWLAEAYRASRDLLDADDRSYRHVIGAVVACSRAFFDETGGFDESFTEYGGEDWEWAYRAWLLGGVFAHVPTAVAWHDGPDAAGRGDLAGKNAEALRLADLIPVAGSRPRGRASDRIDVLVTAPPRAGDAERFVSVDSALAALHGAEAETDDARRTDRVRVRVELLRPVLVTGTDLSAAVEHVSSAQLGSLVLTRDGEDLVRIVSARAEARERRWRRSDLFAREKREAPSLVPIGSDVDVEAYLGGWLHT